LTNVYRHAQATKACVTVREAGGFVFVTVADDGVGGMRCHPRGLEERAAVVGGHLLVDSPAAAGTTVRAALPLPSLVSR
jgi:signal transduction histidine kinase